MEITSKYQIGQEIYPFAKDGATPYGFKIFDIKAGGMGVVYLVDNIDNFVTTGQKSALKTVQEWCVEEPHIIKRFSREAEVWVKLGNHRNIVHAILVFHYLTRPYISMEFIDGEDLGSLISREQLSVPHAIKLAMQFCEGMIHATNIFQDFVHRDIKPANCLIDKSGVLKVTDFGLVKAIQAEEPVLDGFTNHSETGSFRTKAGQYGFGTFPYMAPEQFEDFTQTDLRSDIYSFGIMFYEMLTGKRPFFATDAHGWHHAHRHVQPTDPSSLNPEIPQIISYLINKCLEKEPNDRPPSFQEVLTVLAIAIDEPEEISLVSGVESPLENIENGLSIAARAFSLSQLGKNNEALILINKAIKISSENPLVWNLKCNILNALNRHEESLQCVNRAISLKSDDPTLLENKVKLLQLTENFEEALSEVIKCVVRFPNNYSFYVSKATILIDMDRRDDACKTIDSALEVFPHNVHVLVWKAKFLQAQQEYVKALSFIEHAIDLNPEDDEEWLNKIDEAWLLKAKSLIYIGNLREAYKCFEISITFNPQNSESLHILGRLHLRDLEGIEYNVEKGLSFIKRAASLGQPDAIDWLHEFNQEKKEI